MGLCSAEGDKELVMTVFDVGEGPLSFYMYNLFEHRFSLDSENIRACLESRQRYILARQNSF